MTGSKKIFFGILGAMLSSAIAFSVAQAQTTTTTLMVECRSASINGYLNLNGNQSASVWFEWGPTFSLGNSTPRQTFYSNSNFSQTLSGLSENTLYYYRAAASNNISVEYGEIKSFRTPTCSTPLQVVTVAATSVANASARLNGIVTSPGGTSSLFGYFEYGTTPSLGTTTPNKNIGTGQTVSFLEPLLNLAPNTTYYFRAVASNQYETARGEILNFRTAGSPVFVNTGSSSIGSGITVVNSTSRRATNVSTSTGTVRTSSVFLSISREGEGVVQGDIVEYLVNYKNISSRNLLDAVLRVGVPKEFKFIETSRGYFSEINSLVVVALGNLLPEEEGSVRIFVRVAGDAEINKVVITTAHLAYTISTNNSQEEAFAYAKNTILASGRGEAKLGALALLVGDDFLPNSLLGWLLLVLLIILIALSIRKAYSRPQLVVNER